MIKIAEEFSCIDATISDNVVRKLVYNEFGTTSSQIVQVGVRKSICPNVWTNGASVPNCLYKAFQSVGKSADVCIKSLNSTDSTDRFFSHIGNFKFPYRVKNHVSLSWLSCNIYENKTL